MTRFTLAVAALCSLAVLLLVRSVDAPATVEACPGHRAGLLFYRDLTWQRQDARGVHRSRYGFAHRSPSCRYVAEYAVPLWRGRAAFERKALARHRELQRTRWSSSAGNVVAAICAAFGPECAKAVRVARCESHLNPRAVSAGGLYWGTFQFGAYARATYGFAWDPWTQAKAAAAMRRAEGWTPWPVCGRR